MSQRVSFLILAQLGVLACSKDPTPPPATPETASSLSVPPMPPSAVASTPPPPEPTTSASGKVVRTGGPEEPITNPGVECKSDLDCRDNKYCSIQEGKKLGKCQPHMTRGRPLLVDGDTHIADYTRPFEPRVTSDEISRLHEAAREEHASIAAFARTIAELMAFGAPTWLLTETHRALGDEIRHTDRSLAMLEKLTGERPDVGHLEAAVAPLARPIEDFFRDVLRGGAIGETMAAAEAETRQLATTDEELRAFYEMIVVDESRHAALAFKTLRWLLERDPSMRRILDEERVALAPLVRPLFETAFS